MATALKHYSVTTEREFVNVSIEKSDLPDNFADGDIAIQLESHSCVLEAPGPQVSWTFSVNYQSARLIASHLINAVNSVSQCPARDQYNFEGDIKFGSAEIMILPNNGNPPTIGFSVEGIVIQHKAWWEVELSPDMATELAGALLNLANLTEVEVLAGSGAHHNQGAGSEIKVEKDGA